MTDTALSKEIIAWLLRRLNAKDSAEFMLMISVQKLPLSDDDKLHDLKLDELTEMVDQQNTRYNDC